MDAPQPWEHRPTAATSTCNHSYRAQGVVGGTKKESCESATLIHTSDTPFGLSLKLKGVSELNDIK